MAVGAVKYVKEAIPIRLYKQLAWLSTEIQIQQHWDLNCIPVMDIMGGELEIPFQLSGIYIESHHAVSVKIVALAVFTV